MDVTCPYHYQGLTCNHYKGHENISLSLKQAFRIKMALLKYSIAK